MRPNVLFIIADQLTPFVVGAYGNPAVKTPNLDRLAASGVRFDAAYTPSPLCAPARAAMMTGRHASRIGAFDNSSLLPADQPTFAHYLTNAGYECVASGKMHFIGPDQLHGFNRRLTTNIYPADFSWTRSRAWEDKPVSFPDRLGPAYVAGNRNNEHGMGARRWNWHLEYDERTHAQALEFLRRHRLDDWYRGTPASQANGGAGRRPFFLTVSYHHPHQPFQVPKRYWDMYEDVEIPLPETPEGMERFWSKLDSWLHYSHGLNARNVTDPENLKLMHRCYYGLVTYIDTLVGELMGELEDQGLAESTLVVFTSDHGEMLGARGMIQKRCFYERSARVPLIFRFPDGRGAGPVVRKPVSLIDLLPTFAALAKYPASALYAHDGISLLPVIGGKTIQDRTVFSEQHADGVYAPCFMARRGQYKYIYIHGHAPQLFDLESDPEEWTNIAGRAEVANVEAKLRGDLLQAFNPDQIDREVRASAERRLIIDPAMKINETSWDHEPREDVRTIYSRQKDPAPEAVSRAPFLRGR